MEHKGGMKPHGAAFCIKGRLKGASGQKGKDGQGLVDKKKIHCQELCGTGGLWSVGWCMLGALW